MQAMIVQGLVLHCMLFNPIAPQNCSRAFRRSQRIENHSSFVLWLLKILDPRCQTLNKDEKLDSRTLSAHIKNTADGQSFTSRKKLSHLTHVKLCLELRISHIRVWRIGFELWILACLLACLLCYQSWWWACCPKRAERRQKKKCTRR